MLSTLRAATGGIVAKILLLLLVASFAVWGASGAFIGGTGNSTVEFGDTAVGVTDYRLAYDLQANAMSRQLGQRITREQARAFGLDQQCFPRSSQAPSWMKARARWVSAFRPTGWPR